MLLMLMRSRVAARVALLLVFACSAALVLWSGTTLKYFDEFDYHNLAHSLLREHEFALGGHLTLIRPPGYPFALAGIYALIDSVLFAKLANCIALAASAGLLSRLCTRLYSAPGALVSLIVLCYPLFAYAASTLYPQTLGGLLLLSSIVLVSGPERSPGRLVAAGVIMGMLCLMIPSFLYIVPLQVLYVMFRELPDLKRMLWRALLLGLLAALVVAPWTLRNELLFGHFVPVSANSGFNLAIGNSAFTPPNGKTDPATACPDVPYDPDEAKVDRELAQCALRWIRANPGPAFNLYVAKVLNYFNYRNELATASEQRSWQDWLVFVTYYPLLGLALLRLGFWRRYRLHSTETLLYVIYFGNALLTAVFFTRIRFRIPFDLLLVAIDASFVAYLLAGRSVGAAGVGRSGASTSLASSS